MPGITRYSSYVPFFRLSRAAAFGAGRGERAVASYDEDAVSMAVESARDALAGPAGTDGIRAVAFATTSPPYAEKLNAATVHAALGLPDAAASFELGSSFRAGLSALLVGLDVAGAGRPSLVSAAEVVIGAPGGARESAGGDAAASFVTGPDGESLAVLLGRASATTEVLDAWRLPESRFASHWEERFGAEALAPVLADTAVRALRDAGVEPSELSSAIVDAANPRAAAGLPAALQLKPEQLADPLAASVGRAGAAHAGLLLARALDAASPGDRILVASLADGCDAAVFQVTDRIGRGRPARRVDAWIASKRVDLAYHTYLRWRGILPFEPPRRPDPERPAAPTMRRHEAWKLGFVGSRCQSCGAGHLPPQRVCSACGAVDRMQQEPFADRACRIATYTLDHLAYSLQPPVVAAVLDFDDGGRLACEVTDVDPAKVAIGDALGMTFRRLYTGQGRPQLLLEGKRPEDRLTGGRGVASRGIKDRVAILRRKGVQVVPDGRFDLEGPQPVNPDGGLKSFGHPIGASGLRMMYEMWLQLRGGRAPDPEPEAGADPQPRRTAGTLRLVHLRRRPLRA